MAKDYQETEEPIIITKKTGVALGLVGIIIAFVIGLMVNVNIKDSQSDKRYYELLQLIKDNANAITNLNNAMTTHTTQKGTHYDLAERLNNLERKH